MCPAFYRHEWRPCLSNSKDIFIRINEGEIRPAGLVSKVAVAEMRFNTRYPSVNLASPVLYDCMSNMNRKADRSFKRRVDVRVKCTKVNYCMHWT